MKKKRWIFLLATSPICNVAIWFTTYLLCGTVETGYINYWIGITSIINIVALRYELDLAQKRKFPLGSAEHFQTFFGGRRVCQGQCAQVWKKL